MLLDIGMMARVFANSLGDLGSIPGRVIPKSQKIVLDTSFLTLSIIRYGSRVKWSNPGKGVVPSPTPWCCSYWKGSFWVTFNYGLLYIYIYIYIYENGAYMEFTIFFVSVTFLKNMFPADMGTSHVKETQNISYLMHMYIYIYI